MLSPMDLGNDQPSPAILMLSDFKAALLGALTSLLASRSGMIQRLDQQWESHYGITQKVANKVRKIVENFIEKYDFCDLF